MSQPIITNIIIQGFRGIKRCELKDLKAINVLMGRCGSVDTLLTKVRRFSVFQP